MFSDVLTGSGYVVLTMSLCDTLSTNLDSQLIFFNFNNYMIAH